MIGRLVAVLCDALQLWIDFYHYKAYIFYHLVWKKFGKYERLPIDKTRRAL